MRNGLIGLVVPMVLACATVIAGCSNNDGGGGGTGGSSSGGSGGTGGVLGSGGSGGGGSSGSSVTTLSGTQALNALTADEAAKLCDDTYAYFASAIPQATGCKWKGLSYATSSSAPTDEKLQSNCTTKETSCLGATPTEVWPNPGCNDLPSTCTATVAEYSACIADEVASFITTVDGFVSCADFTTDGTTVIWDFMGAEPPASCSSLATKCPDLSYPTVIIM
jgi:hypothetical protein